MGELFHGFCLLNNITLIYSNIYLVVFSSNVNISCCSDLIRNGGWVGTENRGRLISNYF